MWAVGCVLGELLSHRALFPATTELHALRMQVDLLGTPTRAAWPVSGGADGAGGQNPSPRPWEVAPSL